jgi:hypothetical protein
VKGAGSSLAGLVALASAALAASVGGVRSGGVNVRTSAERSGAGETDGVRATGRFALAGRAMMASGTVCSG